MGSDLDDCETFAFDLEIAPLDDVAMPDYCINSGDMPPRLGVLYTILYVGVPYGPKKDRIPRYILYKYRYINSLFRL